VAVSSVQAEEPAYVLRGADAACLIEHSDSYLAIARDLYFVSLDECPNTERVAAGSFARNLASTPSFDGREAAWDNLITLTRAHLTCLGTLTPPLDAELYLFAPSACSLTRFDRDAAEND